MTELGEYGFMLKTDRTLDWVKRLFADTSKKIVFHNAKFDLKMFYFEGVDVFANADGKGAECHCTLILSKLYNGLMPQYDLRWLGIHYLNRSTAAKDEVTDWLKANRHTFVKKHGRVPNFSDAPISVVRARALWDVETTLQLFWFMFPKVKSVSSPLYETEQGLMFVCIDMENQGVEVDITRAKALRDESLRGIKVLRGVLDKLVCPIVLHRSRTRKRQGEKYKEPYDETIAEGFNPSSPLQMPAAFEKLGIHLRYKTKPKKGKKGGRPSGGGRWSFDEYSMIRYSHPYIAAIIRDSGEEGWPFDRWFNTVKQTIAEEKLPPSQWLPPLCLKLTELRKMVVTYYDHIINDAVDVRVDTDGIERGTLHCLFNQSEAMTGRFSSSRPNLQNLPRILGPRECFVSRKGRTWYHFDYEQVEMKFFVHFAEDEDMAKAIEQDIHEYVAAEIYACSREEVTKERRKRAKGINFGIVYGAGAPTMAETLTRKGLLTSNQEASLLVGRYHQRFPSVRRITSTFASEISRNGFITNPFGRLYHIASRQAYKALNYMCQGTSADLMKQRMLRVWKFLRNRGLRTRLLVTVHDELILEVPRCEQQDQDVVLAPIRRIMEEPKQFFIPITVGVERSRRWSSKENVTLEG